MAGDDQGCKRGPAVSEDEPTSKRSKSTLVEKLGLKGSLSERVLHIEKPALKGSDYDEQLSDESIATKKAASQGPEYVSKDDLLSEQSTATKKPSLKGPEYVSKDDLLSEQSTATKKPSLKGPEYVSKDDLLSEQSTATKKPAMKGSEYVSKDDLLPAKKPAWKSPMSVSEDERRLASQSTLANKPALKCSRSVSEGGLLSAQSKSVAVGNLALKRAGSVSEDEPEKKRTKSDDHPSEQFMIALDMLPIDLVQDILVRLPSTAILRFRSVCQSWYAMLTNIQFLQEHHQLQEAKPLLIYSDDHISSQLTVRVDSSDLYRCENGQVFHYKDASASRNVSFQVCGSCNGLLLISHSRDTFICNPCTRRWAVIPRFKVLGFYNISNEYRILHAYADFTSRRSMVLGEKKSRFCIYDVTSRSDRKLDCPVASKALEKEIEESVHLLVNSKSTIFKRALHWWLPSTRKTVVFHIAEEKFQFMKAPEVDTETWSPFCVIDSKLSLGVVDETMQSLDVWTLQDYYAENWSVKFRIELAAPSRSLVSNEEMSPVFLLSEKENLIMLYMDHFVHARFTADLMVKKVYYTSRKKTFLAPYFLKPTLVPHAFLDHYNDEKLPADRVYPQLFRNGFPFFKCLVSERKYFQNTVVIGGTLPLVDVLRSICHTVSKIYELKYGNAAFNANDYITAIKHYTEAIKNKTDEAIIAKRAISYFNLDMFHECISDCDLVLEKRERICSNVLAKSLGTKGVAVSKLAKSCEDFDVGIGLMQEAHALTENANFKVFLAKALAAVDSAKNKLLEKAMNAVADVSKLDQ